MMRNTTLLLLFSILFLPQINGQEIIKPNIVFIYADDLGWQDTQLNDVGDVVPWETPNMLALAEDGANFSQAYASAPTCAPSRGGTMSGRMPLKTKMTHVAGGQIPKVKLSNKTIESYYPGRLQLDEVTIAEALNPLGYVSGHVGKWHMAANHNIYPEAVDQGFDYQDTDRGITRSMGDRSVDFATDAVDDPYRLDADGRPYDAVTELALDFMDDNKEEPFFLYMAHWLVHSPIQTRDLALLEYYCDKLGIPVPTTDANITTSGQTNPYYGAMIASLDWSLGRVVDYLKVTDDPRNPGMKLFDTTYIIFASDNGGAENHGSEIITDNFPLDLGKTHTKEGGLRTPFVITGPGIVENQVYDNIVSHLDFYPTIMEVTGADAVLDANVLNNLDGVSLFPFLSGTETEIKNSDNTERTDLFWHYPHGQDERASSAIRSGNYKLYKIYDNGDYYKAYQLYNDDGSDSDIEEMFDVIDTMPVSLKNEMILKLETLLAENDTRIPHFNPDYNGDPLVNQDIVPSITSTVYDENTGVATATLTTNPGDAIIETAYLLYRIEEVDTPEEEWFELPATIDGNVITADVPEVATGVVFTLIDENNFVVISDAISIFNPHKIILANAVGEQAFKVVDEYAELIGNTTIGGTAYLQARTEEGGDGAKFYVKAPADVETIICDKITLGIISQSADTVNVDIIIDGETQSFTYTSTNNNTPELFEFDTPVTFTQSSKEIQVITTSLSNSSGLTPRVRFVDLFFNVLGATQPLSEITLNTTEEQQQFEPESTDVYAELIGNTTTGGAFVQMRTEGGGDGFNINVKATESVLCEKIVFRVRSLAGDTANFDVTIGGETQSFEYTSTNSTADLYYEFDMPTTITETAQTMEFLVTNLTNATAGTTPRFRVYAVTYHLDLSTLGVNEVIEAREALKLFPNPVKGTFSLSKSVASGILYSVHGAKAYEFNNQYQDIDISELKTGLYFLQVIHEDGSKSTLKLLKE
ncbi:sulfatase-like hydrolase/transferase [Winogradskyella helgolandensis]|uniref:sulfatase-like hydrolase/transferase n=1 Tax=Winogradskyella helgolandensis TaxID=2697010 RepID=UPI0015C9B476|nr:sulfatase-like hydrolase/transferase [Winogradskyella helgolandensis]